MDYNSSRKKLTLPEYGRHIQKMVDHCVTISDTEERTRCANAIIRNMGNMFPHLRDVPDFKHKLWDHLAVMSDFKLDIETPFPLPEKSKLNERPKKIPYRNNKMSYKHYGETVERLIEKAIEMEDGSHKDHLIMLIASNMKRSLMSWNKDFPGDERVFDDIKKLSNGRLTINPEIKLPSCQSSNNNHNTSQNNRNQGQHRNFGRNNQRRYDRK